jgi:PLP dependent protein
MNSKTEIKLNYESIQNRIRKLNPKVSLIAVSKGQPVESIISLYELGHRDFGENYVQELQEKGQEISKKGIKDIRWHFIGHLQTNKINVALQHISFLHTIDSVKLIQKISERLKDRSLPVFIEVKLSNEKDKTGISEEELPVLANHAAELENIHLQGLMTIPELGLSEDQLRKTYQRLKSLEASLRPSSNGYLSMGMSQDYEVAIQEGATHVRIGTALFGERQKRSK